MYGEVSSAYSFDFTVCFSVLVPLAGHARRTVDQIAKLFDLTFH